MYFSLFGKCLESFESNWEKGECFFKFKPAEEVEEPVRAPTSQKVMIKNKR